MTLKWLEMVTISILLPPSASLLYISCSPSSNSHDFASSLTLSFSACPLAAPSCPCSFLQPSLHLKPSNAPLITLHCSHHELFHICSSAREIGHKADTGKALCLAKWGTAGNSRAEGCFPLRQSSWLVWGRRGKWHSRVQCTAVHNWSNTLSKHCVVQRSWPQRALKQSPGAQHCLWGRESRGELATQAWGSVREEWILPRYIFKEPTSCS